MKGCAALICLGLAACVVAFPAQAGVVIGGTRQIYPAQSREITIQLTNDDKKNPRLVQVWLDSGNKDLTAEESEVPFTITPPAFRMEPGKGQALRMVYTKEPLPADKESVFWLNVLEIPPKIENLEEENQLRFAFRTRIKVFFRPQSLPGKPQDAADQLNWHLLTTEQGSVLEVRNPSPYHVSFQQVALAMGEGVNAKLNTSDQYEMVAPGASQRYLLSEPVGVLPAGAHVQFSMINDYGVFMPMQAPVLPAGH